MGYKQDDRPIKSSEEFSERLKESSARESEGAREARKKDHPQAFAPRSTSRRGRH
jgi:hypothetical protein